MHTPQQSNLNLILQNEFHMDIKFSPECRISHSTLKRYHFHTTSANSLLEAIAVWCTYYSRPRLYRIPTLDLYLYYYVIILTLSLSTYDGNCFPKPQCSNYFRTIQNTYSKTYQQWWSVCLFLRFALS